MGFYAALTMNTLELYTRTKTNLKNTILSRKRQATKKYLYDDSIYINRWQTCTVMLFRNTFLCAKTLKKRRVNTRFRMVLPLSALRAGRGGVKMSVMG